MGKAAKEHRKKVAKRNANLKQKEKTMQKIWQQAFEDQMKVLQEKFATMSGDTASGETTPDLIELFGNEQETTLQEESESTEPVSGE